MVKKSAPIILSLLTACAVLAVLGCSGDDNSTGLDGPDVPVLTTSAVSGVTQATAQCGGDITSDGGSAVTARGVSWSMYASPTAADNKTTDSSGTGSFASSITGLRPGTQYYVRAYATNSSGIGYGSARSFTSTSSGTVTDLDGNVYQTVTIGTQVWMAENLKVTHYRNGSPIPHAADDTLWNRAIAGAYCDYDNDTNNVATFGRLYNFIAVEDGRNIAPVGWHVPTDAEWKTLEMYLGMSQNDADATGWRGTDEGGKLKETGTTHWMTPNTSATNESGFSAMPGGYRNYSGSFVNLGNSGYAYFWSSTVYSSFRAWSRNLYSDHSDIVRNDLEKKDGFSIRCVKD